VPEGRARKLPGFLANTKVGERDKAEAAELKEAAGNAAKAYGQVGRCTRLTFPYTAGRAVLAPAGRELLLLELLLSLHNHHRCQFFGGKSVDLIGEMHRSHVCRSVCPSACLLDGQSVRLCGRSQSVRLSHLKAEYLFVWRRS
jgi:hypothetical protein